MKKILTMLALSVVFIASAKNQKKLSNQTFKPLCMQVTLITSCGLNETTTWCPEYGDTIQCLMNEWDSYDYVYCRQP